MDIHLVRCTHGNEQIRTHVVCNTFVAIVWDVGFHMKQKQLHVLLLTMFNSSHWWVNIVLTKNEIPTLSNIVIIDQMHADLHNP
jgi:hypothetical protein